MILCSNLSSRNCMCYSRTGLLVVKENRRLHALRVRFLSQHRLHSVVLPTARRQRKALKKATTTTTTQQKLHAFFN